MKCGSLREGIFCGCRLARGGILLLLIINLFESRQFKLTIYNKAVIINMLNSKTYASRHARNFIIIKSSGYNSGRIISLIVFIKSVTFGYLESVNEFSCFTRKVYSTGAVLVRGRHFCIKKNRQTKVFNGCRFYQVNSPRIHRSNHKEYPVFQTKVIDFY